MSRTLQPLFGANIDPATDDPKEPFRRAAIADAQGLDLITIQDHPYNRHHLDTWTLLTALAVSTERVHVGTNVANLPLRGPAMLAKMAASLDVLSGGRVELGLGAGTFWAGIKALGGPERSPGRAFSAFNDALHIIRGLWDHADGSFTYEGAVYQVKGARFGPQPAHRIRIWVGASGPRMMNLIGRLADGVLVSTTYEPPQRLLVINAQINAGAEEAGRSPQEVRRGYNLMGLLEPGRAASRPDGLPESAIYGPVQHWVEQIQRFYQDYRQDTFIFWPIQGDERQQIEVFAREVVPAVREALAGSG